MSNAKRFFINGIILACATVILRAVSVSFNAFVTKALGEEAVGLFTLVMSVYSLAIVFATSAVNLASVRLISGRLAELEKMNASGAEIRKALKIRLRGCIIYSLIFSLSASLFVFNFAPFIGERLLGDPRTVLSVRMLALSLPFVSLGSAVSGYFTGVRKAYKNAAISAFEQLMKIFLITLGLVTVAPRGIEYACLAVVGGGALGEGLSLICDIAFYYTDRIRSRGNAKASPSSSGSLRATFRIAFPVALGSYVRQGLVCAEHIAIPSSLKKSGASSSEALASYGVLHGMVFPLIFFPASVLNSFSSLLVPEITACMATGQQKKATLIAEKVIRACLVFSFATSCVFLCFSDILGRSIYDSHQAGAYLAFIAPLIPIMYLDTTVDFILKGLDQQVYTMVVNILDAFCSLALVLILVPRFAIGGYIASVYLIEIMNCALSLGRLISVANICPKLAWILRPFAAIALSYAAMRLLLSSLFLPSLPLYLNMLLCIALTAFFMRITGAVTKNDINYIKNTVKSVKNP